MARGGVLGLRQVLFASILQEDFRSNESHESFSDCGK